MRRPAIESSNGSPTQSDIDLDVEILDFGTVEVLGQVCADGEREDVRYWITDLGRTALAEARREKALKFIRPFGQGPTVAEVVASKSAHCSALQPTVA
jgi:hypothetical protein